MNIIYLNHYAGSPAHGMEYRPYYLAREWVRLGHRVQMLAADFSHVRATQPAPGDETIDGIAYRWYPTPRYLGHGLGQARGELEPLLAVIVAIGEEVLADEHAQMRADGAGEEQERQQQHRREQERELERAPPVAASRAPGPSPRAGPRLS